MPFTTSSARNGPEASDGSRAECVLGKEPNVQYPVEMAMEA